MVAVLGRNGQSRKGVIVKEVTPEKYFGTFITVRFQQSTSVNLFFIPERNKVKPAGFSESLWNTITSFNAFTLIDADSSNKTEGIKCFLFRQTVAEAEADAFINELISWNRRRPLFLEKYRNGQICYTRKEIAEAKKRGYTVFVKSEFGAGGYYEKAENVSR